MKKFTKLFLSCAAVAAVTAAVATSAMAAEKTLTASYGTNATTGLGEVTITCASKDDMKTLLILKPNASKSDNKTADSLQIDQAAEITTATIPALNEENEADKGTYTVLVGGTSGDIYVGSFSIGGTEILVGDADQNQTVTNNDAKLIMQVNAKMKEFEGNGKLAADAWVMVDKETLVHKTYPNIISLGDVAGVPTSKTSAAIRVQVPLAAKNLISLMEGKEPTEKYNGYAACPIVTDYGHVLLCEFDYKKEPATSFPFTLIDTSKEQWLAWLLKVYILKPMYFYGMLNGYA